MRKNKWFPGGYLNVPLFIQFNCELVQDGSSNDNDILVSCTVGKVKMQAIVHLYSNNGFAFSWPIINPLHSFLFCFVFFAVFQHSY